MERQTHPSDGQHLPLGHPPVGQQGPIGSPHRRTRRCDRVLRTATAVPRTALRRHGVDQRPRRRAGAARRLDPFPARPRGRSTASSSNEAFDELDRPDAHHGGRRRRPHGRVQGARGPGQAGAEHGAQHRVRHRRPPTSRPAGRQHRNDLRPDRLRRPPNRSAASPARSAHPTPSAPRCAHRSAPRWSAAAGASSCVPRPATRSSSRPIRRSSRPCPSRAGSVVKTGLDPVALLRQPRAARRCVDIEVTNTADVIDGVTAIVDGINPDWIRLERPMLSLFPEASERMTLVFDIPKSCPAGDYLVVVRIVSTIDFDRQSVHDFWLTVGVVTGVELDLRPTIVTGGAEERLDATITNTGNAPATITVTALEPTREVDCRVDPSTIAARTRQPRPSCRSCCAGPGRGSVNRPPRQIHITAEIDDLVVEKIATFNQKPRIPRGLLTALMLAGIILLWAFIFLWVISEMRNSEPSAKATGTYLIDGPGEHPARGDRRDDRRHRHREHDRSRAAAHHRRGDSYRLRRTASPCRSGRRPPATTASTCCRASSLATTDSASAPTVSSPVRLRRRRRRVTSSRSRRPRTSPGVDVVLVGQESFITGQIALPPGSEGVPLDGRGADGPGELRRRRPGEVPTATQITTDGTINLGPLPTPADVPRDRDGRRVRHPTVRTVPRWQRHRASSTRSTSWPPTVRSAARSSTRTTDRSAASRSPPDPASTELKASRRPPATRARSVSSGWRRPRRTCSRSNSTGYTSETKALSLTAGGNALLSAPR